MTQRASELEVLCACADSCAKDALIDRLRAAGKKIIEADDEFRAALGPHWEGDPVSDACEAARDLFCMTNQQKAPSDGR